MQQMVQESADDIHSLKATTITLEMWSYQVVCSMIWLLWVKHFSRIEICGQSIEMDGDGMRVHHIREWYIEF
jgi:hypothetical protein